jgi:hypothetical protein
LLIQYVNSVTDGSARGLSRVWAHLDSGESWYVLNTRPSQTAASVRRLECRLCQLRSPNCRVSAPQGAQFVAQSHLGETFFFRNPIKDLRQVHAPPNLTN